MIDHANTCPDMQHIDLPFIAHGIVWQQCRTCTAQHPVGSHHWVAGRRQCYPCRAAGKKSLMVGRPPTVVEIAYAAAERQVRLLEGMTADPAPLALGLLGVPMRYLDGKRGKWRARVSKALEAHWHDSVRTVPCEWSQSTDERH